jgi:hypothetical protein
VYEIFICICLIDLNVVIQTIKEDHYAHKDVFANVVMQDYNI